MSLLLKIRSNDLPPYYIYTRAYHQFFCLNSNGVIAAQSRAEFGGIKGSKMFTIIRAGVDYILQFNEELIQKSQVNFPGPTKNNFLNQDPLSPPRDGSLLVKKPERFFVCGSELTCIPTSLTCEALAHTNWDGRRKKINDSLWSIGFSLGPYSFTSRIFKDAIYTLGSAHTDSIYLPLEGISRSHISFTVLESGEISLTSKAGAKISPCASEIRHCLTARCSDRQEANSTEVIGTSRVDLEPLNLSVTLTRRAL